MVNCYACGHADTSHMAEGEGIGGQRPCMKVTRWQPGTSLATICGCSDYVPEPDASPVHPLETCRYCGHTYQDHTPECKWEFDDCKEFVRQS